MMNRRTFVGSLLGSASLVMAGPLLHLVGPEASGQMLARFRLARRNAPPVIYTDVPMLLDADGTMRVVGDLVFESHEDGETICGLTAVVPALVAGRMLELPCKWSLRETVLHKGMTLTMRDIHARCTFA